MQDDNTPRRTHRFRWLWITAAVLGGLFVAAGISAYVMYQHLDDWLRTRAIASMEAKFHAHVTLQHLEFSRKARTVVGGGLAITPIGMEQFPPVVTVQKFAFFFSPRELLSPRRHVSNVSVDGMVITIPPASARLSNAPVADSNRPKPFGGFATSTALEILSFKATNSQLILMHDAAAKPATVFDLMSVRVSQGHSGAPMHYVADLTNPRPKGIIHATGWFGPWNAAAPRQTNISGDYTFTNADLATTKGIAGILSSTGHFAGPLSRLVVDGSSETPDFRLDEAQHPVALFTKYHAIVDGSTGDTYLQPVQAHFRNTYFVCTGSVVNIKGQGHRVSLDVTMQKGRVEDVLWLASKSLRPIMTGALTLHTSFELPPDPAHRRTVLQRVGMNGNFHLHGVTFTNPDWDRQIDEVSLRTQGKPEEAQELSGQKGEDDVRILSEMSGNFTLDRALLALHPAQFTMPGIDADVEGSYALDTGMIDVNGQARLSVPVSKMLTGWKSKVAKLADPFFHHQGAPALIPFRVYGPRDNPEFRVQLFKGFSVGMKKKGHESQATDK